MSRRVWWAMVAATLAAVPSQAAGNWHAEVTAATDYIFRGFSRADYHARHPAGQLGEKARGR